LKTETIER
jgi:hypothetical protein